MFTLDLKDQIMDQSQYINYLAIDLLEMLGNDCPTQEEIDIAESFIISIFYHKRKAMEVRF